MIELFTAGMVELCGGGGGGGGGMVDGSVACARAGGQAGG